MATVMGAVTIPAAQGRKPRQGAWTRLAEPVSSRVALTTGLQGPFPLLEASLGWVCRGAPLCLEREEGRGQLGIWRQGAGSVAVERLRSLERQTESLTASQNNPARVRFPGGSSRRWSSDEGCTCNGVWWAGWGWPWGWAGLQPVSPALQSVGESLSPPGLRLHNGPAGELPEDRASLIHLGNGGVHRLRGISRRAPSRVLLKQL